ncbi:MAG: type II toxin-antitoxin system RelE/ParE family toxin [Clostridia bacterium]|nr:type II toxin-antitoxin system RelE/ParE family toxin [Clostridia bacterium]
MFEIEIYEDKNGKSDIKEYICKLNSSNSKEDRIKFNKIIAYIRMLEKYGLSLGEPYIKHIKDNLWELRPVKDRILFAYLFNNKFILLNVFRKQTSKTPKNEIEKAERLLNEYNKRSDKYGK